MVKCPRGTPSQVKANLEYINRPSTVSNGSDLKGQAEKESDVPVEELDASDLDSIRADKRCPPTAKDELVYFFISSFLDILLKSWEGTPCVKQKLGMRHSSSQNSEEFGEDLGPCEPSIVFSTADYLKDLYQKRSSVLSKDKLKKDSESTESEYLNEEDFEDPLTPGQILTDEDVHLVFLNGVWYKGRVSRRLMDGEGYYFWEDGTTFQGDFEGGCVTGKGRLEFPDLSTYEGGVYKAFRHGDGLFCFSDSPVMYSGQWWLGKKHGHGLIVYDYPSEGHNFYKGQWQDGVKEGFGFRQYPSGAKYIGFWSNGTRHGKGVMFWSNNDIYRGYWKEGLMHGFGEYTWNGFINKSLSYPATNTYRGYWEDGKRQGRGVLELKSGAFIDTIWENNTKEGPGVVICCDGTIVSSERLFTQDKPVAGDLADLNKPENRPNHGLKPISIPINSPVHELNLRHHLEKLLRQINEKEERNLEETQLEAELVSVTPNWEILLDVEEKQRVNEELDNLQNFKKIQLLQEEKLLRNFIISKMSALRHCYDCYAKLACDRSPSFGCILLRLFLWQMLIDGELSDTYNSLIDIDDILENEEYILLQEAHDPFERINFWQFIHILIAISWHMYGQYVNGVHPLVLGDKVQDFLEYYGSCECRNVLKTALEYLMEKHLLWERYLPGSGLAPDKMSKFEESDFAPMEAMYMIYCNVGEPHSARDFLNAICCGDTEDDEGPPIIRYFEKLPFYKVEGKNALTIAGELQHIPQNETFNTPEIFQLEGKERKTSPKSELSCFKNIKARRVVMCLMEVCPGIIIDNCIVNMDYKLTFLEFYKTIILCIKTQLKMKMMENMRENIIAEYKIQMEEYEKQLNEFEKLKENQVVSGKKSRQFSELSKKGKK